MKKLLFLLLSVYSIAGLAQQKTDAALITNANTVINATAGQNTASRIGNNFLDLANSKRSVIPLSASGINTYIAASAVVTSYSNGIFDIQFQNGNSGPSTLNINSLGAINLQKLMSGSYTALSSGDIQNNQLLKVWYDQLNNTFQIFLGGTSGALIAANNLSDLSNAGTARTNIGLGSLATQSGTFSGTSSGTNTGDQTITLTGDATGSGTGSFAVNVGKINGTSFAGLGTGLYKNTTGTGVPSIAINSDLPVMSATVGGAVPIPPNDATKFLNGQGAFTTPAGGGSTFTKIVGDIYNETFSGNTLASYTNVSATATITGGILHLSGGANTYVKYIYRTAIKTSFDYMYRKVQFKGITDAATAEGLGIGWLSVNNGGSKIASFLTMDMSSGGTRGTIYLKSTAAGGTISTIATSSTQLSYTNSTDLMEAFIEMNGANIEVYVRNITTGAQPVRLAYTATWLNGATILNVVETSALYAIGGSQDILLDAFGTNNPKNPLIAWASNSVLKGYYAGSSNGRAFNLVSSQIFGESVLISAGSNDLTDINNCFNTDEVTLAPKYLLICEGINEALAGTTLGTTTTVGTYLYKMQQIINSCLTNGIIPILLYETPVTVAAGLQTTLDTYNTGLTTTYGNSYLIIDISTPLKSGGATLAAAYQTGENYHINGAGNALMASTIITALTRILGNPNIVPLSNVTALTQSSSIDNLNFGWTQNWSTLTTGNGLSLTSTSTAIGNNGTVLNAATSGANASSSITSYGAQFLNSRTGTSATDYAALFTASGNGANNIAGSFVANGAATLNTAVTISASGGTTNYALNTTAGRVSINSATTTTANDIMAVWANGSGVSIPLTVVGDVSSRNLLLKDITNAAANTGNGIFFQVKGAATINQMQSLSNINSATLSPFLLYSTGLSIGTAQSTPTSLLHLQAGTTSVAPFGMTSGSLLTTIVAGKAEYNNNFYLSNSALNRPGVGGVIADFTADVGNSGSAETDLFTYTTKASTLGSTGEKLTFTITGNVIGSATASRTINCYFAGTNIGTVSAATISTTGNFKAVVEVIRTGSTTARASVVISVDNLTLTTPVTETDLTGLTFTNTNIIKITGTSSGTGSATNDIVAKLGWINWFPGANN